MIYKKLVYKPNRYFVFFSYTIFVIGLLTSIIIGFNHLLDDTFIHLRYCKNLLGAGNLFYNYNQESFGTSSLAYLFYISSFLSFFDEKYWPLIIKLSSITAHIFSILLLLKISFNHKKYQIYLYNFIITLIIIFFLLAVPSITRWLTDGMETSLGVLFALLSVYIVGNIDNIRNNFLYNYLISIVIVLPGLLRIDLLPMVLANMIFLFLIDRDSLKKHRIIYIMVPLIMSLWILITIIFSHNFIPDSAIAKQSRKFDFMWLFSFLKSMTSTSPVWLGLALISLVFLFNRKYIGGHNQLILLNGLFPITSQLVAGTIFGQAIHGARYFLPSLAYLCALIFFIINKNNFFQSFPKFNMKISILFLIIIITAIIHTFISWTPINRVIRGSYLYIPSELKNQNLTIGVADIGQIGWYTNSRIFDLSALVNGRDIAKTISNKRIEKLIIKMGFPDYLILKQGDLEEYKISDNKIILSNKSQYQTYQKTNFLIMRMYNIKGSLDWFLWEKLK